LISKQIPFTGSEIFPHEKEKSPLELVTNSTSSEEDGEDSPVGNLGGGFRFCHSSGDDRNFSIRSGENFSIEKKIVGEEEKLLNRRKLGEKKNFSIEEEVGGEEKLLD